MTEIPFIDPPADPENYALLVSECFPHELDPDSRVAADFGSFVAVSMACKRCGCRISGSFASTPARLAL